MSHSLAYSRLIAIAVLMAACSGGSDSTGPDGGGGNQNPPPTPTVTLTVDPASTSIVAGATATVTATIVRGGGFTGAVTIAGTGAPTGVTITGGTIAAGATTTSVSIASAASAAASTTNLSITGSASGVTISPKTVALTVTPATAQIGVTLEGEMGGDQFGTAVSLSSSGSRVVIGAPFNNATGNDAGHARVFERSGNTWTQMGVDLDGDVAEDRFGGAVAMADNGARIAVGSYLNDGGDTNSGEVKVFEWSGTAWTQVGANIYGGKGRGAGAAVAINATGTRVVTGGPGVGSTTGEVRIYEYTGGAWTQMGNTISGTLENGTSVTMSDNGSRIALGLPSAAGSSKPGSVQVYDWNGSVWVQVGATLDGEAIVDNFGAALSLSSDGSVLAVGAPGNDGGGSGAGHVRVFRLTGGAWVQAGGDIDGPVGAGFGASVSIANDGNKLIALGFGGGKQSVGVYTFASNTWTKASAPDFGTGGRMGGVSISGDGKTAGVGEVYFAGTAGNSSGAVRLYGLQ
jgi:hypothetical protein